MSGNQQDGTKWTLSLIEINYDHAQEKKVKQGEGAYVDSEAATER